MEQRRRFDDALAILKKLLKGVDVPSNTKFEHLVGVTLHNIGLVYLCQGNYGGALEHFQRAVKVRTNCLPQNHPDIAVRKEREIYDVNILFFFQYWLTLCPLLSRFRWFGKELVTWLWNHT